MRIALGSTAELETQVSISGDLKFISDAEGNRLKDEVEAVGQLLFRLIESLDK